MGLQLPIVLNHRLSGPLGFLVLFGPPALLPFPPLYLIGLSKACTSWDRFMTLYYFITKIAILGHNFMIQFTVLLQILTFKFYDVILFKAN